MNYYQEISLIDGEKPLYILWSALYEQLHITLAELANIHHIDTIGVSFPKYYYKTHHDKIFASLGNKLRLFANSKEQLQLCLQELTQRLENNFQKNYTDFFHFTSINAVGDKATGFVVVRRYRHDGLEKTARRFAEFKNISLEEALVHCKTYKQADKEYPFINLFSQTNQRNYRLSIWQEQADSPVSGKFNSYGINNQLQSVTLPHW